LSCQQPKHAYKRASQGHVAKPNHLKRPFNVTQPDYDYYSFGYNLAPSPYPPNNPEQST